MATVAQVIRWFLASCALAALAVSAGCSIPGSEVVDGAGIIGTYTVNGTDAVGIEYSGTVVIEAGESSDTYVVQWIVTGAIQEGVGRLRGDRFEVTWRNVASPRGDVGGTATYVLDDEGNLTGTRTIDGVDGVGTEEIFQEA